MQDNEKKPALRFKGFTDPWEQRKLGELSCSFEYGLNAAAKEYDGQNKYLRITDIDDTSRQFVTTDITSPDINLTDADSYKLSDGDVLFARTGASVGKTYLYKKFDGLVYFAGFLIRAKIKESVNAGFIFQNTLTRGYERYIAITSQRSGQPGVNAQEYAEYQLMLPELFEQEKIAKLLEALDTLITLHQRKYEKLVNIKKSMLDKMFPPNGASVPEIRFKGFTDPWEQRKLGEIAKEVVRNDPASDAPIMMITAGNGFIEQSDRYAFNNAGESLKKYILLERGELAYNHGASKLRPYGSCFALTTVEKARIPFVYHCFSVEKSNPEFLSIELNGANVENQLRKIVSSGARMDGLLNIAYSEYTEVTVQLPKKEEQDWIAKFFKHLDTLITLHQRKLEKLQNIKKSCLEKMFA